MNRWLIGARPRTLPAAIAPVLVATSLAGSEKNLLRAGLALLVSLSLQIGVNYANDYSDGVRGSDRNRIGPKRLVASGLASAQAVKNAALITFFFAACIGFILAIQTNLWIIAIGALAILAAWGYTGGKNPYGYSGFGEISVFFFFGLVATIGTYYVQTEYVSLKSAIVALPIGALSCAILAANNIRDRAQDELIGKRTLAVRLGDHRSRIFFVSLLAITHLAALVGLRSFLTLLLLPFTISLSRQVMGGVTGLQLIPILEKTGKLQLAFAALLAITLAI